MTSLTKTFIFILLFNIGIWAWFFVESAFVGTWFLQPLHFSITIFAIISLIGFLFNIIEFIDEF